MKLTVIQEKPIPPPKVYHLELSEAELENIRRAVFYYAERDRFDVRDAQYRLLSIINRPDYHVSLDCSKLHR